MNTVMLIVMTCNSITCKHSEKCCIMLPKVFTNLPQTSWAPPFHLWHSWTLCQLTSLPFVAHTELHILYRPGWRLWQVITAPYQLFSCLVSFLMNRYWKMFVILLLLQWWIPKSIVALYIPGNFLTWFSIHKHISRHPLSSPSPPSK